MFVRETCERNGKRSVEAKNSIRNLSISRSEMAECAAAYGIFIILPDTPIRQSLPMHFYGNLSAKSQEKHTYRIYFMFAQILQLVTESWERADLTDDNYEATWERIQVYKCVVEERDSLFEKGEHLLSLFP